MTLSFTHFCKAALVLFNVTMAANTIDNQAQVLIYLVPRMHDNVQKKELWAVSESTAHPYLLTTLPSQNENVEQIIPFGAFGFLVTGTTNEDFSGQSDLTYNRHTWLDSTITPTTNHAMVVPMNDHSLLVAGGDGVNQTNVMWLTGPAVSERTLLTSLPTGLFGAAAGVVRMPSGNLRLILAGGSLVTATGTYEVTLTCQMLSLETVDSSWESCASLPHTALFKAKDTLVWHNQLVAMTQSELLVYTPETDTWIPLDLPSVHTSYDRLLLNTAGELCLRSRFGVSASVCRRGLDDTQGWTVTKEFDVASFDFPTRLIGTLPLSLLNTCFPAAHTAKNDV